MKTLYKKTLAALLIALSPLFAQAQTSCATGSIITTFAGSHVSGYSGDGGIASAATMGNPFGVAADAAGNIYIADYFNNVVRKVAHATGIITTVAGTGVAGYNGDGMPATAAQLNGPISVTLNGGNLYIADKFNERIRVVDASGNITTIACTGSHGGAAGIPYANEIPATAANLTYPVSVALDCSGNIYIADWGSQTVRRIDASGVIHAFAGTREGNYNGDGIPATAAELNSPSCVLADCYGNVFIADAWNNRIRKVTPDGMISTIAGNGNPTYSGDGGPATAASIWIPNGITFDACGNLYICDWQNNAVRKVTTDGNISTFAGTNTRGYDGDGHNKDSSQIYLPASLAIDGFGNMYIADFGNNVVRAIGFAPGTLPAERKYIAGTTQDLTICENAVSVPVNAQLSIADAASGIQETWSVTIQPHHGTLSGLNATAVSRGGVTAPSGVTYTPEANFTGTDSFTVVMKDGTTAASTTVNVNIVPQPAPGVIAGSNNTSDGQSISLTAVNGDPNGIWSSSNTDIATVDQAGKVTGISNGMVNVAYTVTNGCASKSATASIMIINDNLTASKPVLYPNPNNGIFQYEFMSDKAEQLTLTVADVTCRIVYTQSVSATAGTNYLHITLPAGIPNASMLTVHLGNKTTKYPVTKITVTE
jgi:sugar lactone lactonase YvrE